MLHPQLALCKRSGGQDRARHYDAVITGPSTGQGTLHCPGRSPSAAGSDLSSRQRLHGEVKRTWADNRSAAFSHLVRGMALNIVPAVRAFNDAANASPVSTAAALDLLAARLP
jgi:hypothetical protein